ALTVADQKQRPRPKQEPKQPRRRRRQNIGLKLRRTMHVLTPSSRPGWTPRTLVLVPGQPHVLRRVPVREPATTIATVMAGAAVAAVPMDRHPAGHGAAACRRSRPSRLPRTLPLPIW